MKKKQTQASEQSLVNYKVWVKIEEHGPTEIRRDKAELLAEFCSYSEACAYTQLLSKRFPPNCGEQGCRLFLDLDSSTGLVSTRYIGMLDSTHAERTLDRFAEFMRLDVVWDNPTDRPFEITSICRDDIARRFPKQDTAMLTDKDMKDIARKLSDAYVGFAFWDDLDNIVSDFFTQK